jgi:biopolymer transport protein TolR
MRIRRYKKHNLESQMNVVPYIDVMLVLLIIFMVTAPMFVPGVINLPSVSKSTHVVTKPIQIIIKENGLYQVSFDNMMNNFSNLDMLVSYIKNTLSGKSDTSVVISANKDIKYDIVISVVDRLYMANIKKVALVVKR